MESVERVVMALCVGVFAMFIFFEAIVLNLSRRIERLEQKENEHGEQ